MLYGICILVQRKTLKREKLLKRKAHRTSLDNQKQSNCMVGAFVLGEVSREAVQLKRKWHQTEIWIERKEVKKVLKMYLNTKSVFSSFL